MKLPQKAGTNRLVLPDLPDIARSARLLPDFRGENYTWTWTRSSTGLSFEGSDASSRERGPIIGKKTLTKKSRTSCATIQKIANFHPTHMLEG